MDDDWGLPTATPTLGTPHVALSQNLGEAPQFQKIVRIVPN